MHVQIRASNVKNLVGRLRSADFFGGEIVKELTHIDKSGNAVMVDVSEKNLTLREAVASGKIFVGAEILAAITAGASTKGDVLGVAQVAGIMAAKRTSELIPLCHPLPFSHCSVKFDILSDEEAIKVRSQVKTTWGTGVEMEALTAVSVALLTIYDMCKALSKSMTIGEIRLERKSGGKSGLYVAGGI